MSRLDVVNRESDDRGVERVREEGGEWMNTVQRVKHDERVRDLKEQIMRDQEKLVELQKRKEEVLERSLGNKDKGFWGIQSGGRKKTVKRLDDEISQTILGIQENQILCDRLEKAYCLLLFSFLID